jgi:hypothetical protein
VPHLIVVAAVADLANQPEILPDAAICLLLISDRIR